MVDMTGLCGGWPLEERYKTLFQRRLAMLKQRDADLSDYPAAQACEDSTANEYNDWYLPAKDELNELYEHSNCRGGDGSCSTSGELLNFVSYAYRSSTESNNDRNLHQSFSTGSQGANYKGYLYYVRCVRRTE